LAASTLFAQTAETGSDFLIVLKSHPHPAILANVSVALQDALAGAEADPNLAADYVREYRRRAFLDLSAALDAEQIALADRLTLRAGRIRRYVSSNSLRVTFNDVSTDDVLSDPAVARVVRLSPQAAA